MSTSLARRGIGDDVSGTPEALSSRPAEAFQVQQQLNVFRIQKRLVVTTDCFEVDTSAEHHAGIHAYQEDHRQHDQPGDKDAGRPAVGPDSGCADDDVASRQRFVDGVKRFGVNSRIGIDEANDFALRDGSAAVARGSDGALLDVCYAATTTLGNGGRCIGRCIVGDGAGLRRR